MQTPHKAAKFLVRMAIGCFLILLLALGSMMVRVAPAWVGTPIASLLLSPNNRFELRIVGYDFDCSSQTVAVNTVDRCTIRLQNRPLEMTLTHAKSFQAFETQGIVCQASFAGKAIPCEVGFDYATGNIPNVMIKDSLGLSSADLQALRQQHFLSQISDPDWMNVVLGIAIAAGFLAVLATCFDLQFLRSRNRLVQVFTIFGSACGAFITFWYVSLISVLALGFAD
jgi:hypothetical protein